MPRNPIPSRKGVAAPVPEKPKAEAKPKPFKVKVEADAEVAAPVVDEGDKDVTA